MIILCLRACPLGSFVSERDLEGLHVYSRNRNVFAYSKDVSFVLCLLGCEIKFLGAGGLVLVFFGPASCGLRFSAVVSCAVLFSVIGALVGTHIGMSFHKRR